MTDASNPATTVRGPVSGVCRPVYHSPVYAPTTDPIVTRNAVNLFGPGHSTGTGIQTSSGATVSFTATFVNQSGAPITVGSLVFAGWILTTTGTSNTGNDVPLTADIEYPIGVTHNTMTLASSSTITIPNGSSVATDQVTLATPIPAGASFNVNMSATQANGQKYLGQVSGTTGHAFGLCGVCTTAKKSTLKKQSLYAVGDSIMTNNSGLINSVANYLGCPSMQMSISGTTANTYGASSAANFAKQVAVASLIGATRFVSNFGTNDIGSLTRTYTQILGDLGAMKSAAAAVGVKFTQCTIGPRATTATITASAMVSVGNTITLTVPDATLFDVGAAYTIAGANETGYNGARVCTAVDTGLNTVSFLGQSGLTTPATGTITITTRKPAGTHKFQTPYLSSYVGSSSDRGQLNAAIRAGAFDGYIELGDAMEPTRDSGIWNTGFEDSATQTALKPIITCTVTSSTPRTATRFQLGASFTEGTNAMSNGAAQFITGANIGETHGANGNTNGDYTSAVAFANIPAVGDTVYMIPGSNYATDDGLHPRVAVNSIGSAIYQGGQAMVVNAAIAWLTPLL